MKKLKITLVNFFVIIIICSFLKAEAQVPGTIGVNPKMRVSNPGLNKADTIQLYSLKIDIKIVGQVAITTLDMTYFNFNARVMEGEFNFPLAEGQSVSRFALDINGLLREGVVVEKEKGRKTFEAITRKGADPGLLEMTEGNNFRSRVYPLPAKGARRIVIAYEQELTDKGEVDLYTLPLNIKEKVKNFAVHVEVVKKQVNIDNESNELTNLSFKKWNDSYVSDIVLKDYVPNKQIAFNFPHQNDNIETFTAFKNKDHESSYFYLNIRPEKFNKQKVLPKKITLLWDNSGSAQNRDLKKELSLLQAYIKQIGNLTIELVPFNIKTEKPRIFEITNGNMDGLKLVLEKMNYDGATSLGNIDFTTFKSDEVFLFTDGMSNYGKELPQNSKSIIYTVNSSVTANHNLLKYLAQSSGGVYVNLNRFTVKEATSLLMNMNYHFISAQVKGGKASDIYPSMPTQFYNSFALSGIMQGGSAEVLLNFGFGSTIVYSKLIKINTDNPDDTGLIRRIWAEKKIEELSIFENENKEDITSTGKEYGIVTPNTSLIVLETLNDYLQYHITPPKEMQVEYFKQVNENEKVVSDNFKEHIESVVALSAKQSKWWNTNFPIPGKVNFKKGTSGSVRYVAGVVVDSVRVEEELATVSEADMVSDGIPPPPPPASAERLYETRAIVEEDVVVSGYGVLKKSAGSGSKSEIQINAWDPQTPYLKVLQYASAGQEYQTYLKLKKEYQQTPAFYLDASDFFKNMGKRDTAIRILSNLAELKLESPQLLRVLGIKLMDFGIYDEAVVIFEKVLKLKGEEPQSYRDLGLAYEAKGDFQKAIATLYDVVKKQWDNRFFEIEIIAMNDINAIILKHPKIDYSFIDKRLIKNEPVDIRVVLTWDNDNCDIDLWITDPRNEKCYYQNKLTVLGGKISRDFTQGYGPEEFMLKKALSGEYNIQADYYGTNSQTLLAPVNLHLVFITNFGKSNEKRQEITIRLENKKDVIDIGKFKFSLN
ncbi:MAG: VIT domain-containing protein [Bacteroidia bacterium]|nr:VIT domain-containing protein [Bacteroidia bacterium]